MGNKSRDQIEDRYKWKIEKMFPNEEDFDVQLNQSVDMSKDYLKYQGNVLENLYQALKDKDEIYQLAERCYVYARMRQDEDNRVDKYQGMLSKVESSLATISANLSFMIPELLSNSKEEILNAFEKEPKLEQYRHMIMDMLREQEHVLSEKEENILANLGEVLDAPHDIYSMLNNADLKFGTLSDGTTLTHGNYISIMQGEDRSLRKEAFEAMYMAYMNLANTISKAYSYNVKTDVIGARLRKYSSAREAALSSGNIPQSVYDNLIETVHSYLPCMKKYMEIRKKVLGVDELKMYDVYVPMFKNPYGEIPFEEGVKIVKEALKPMGDEYVNRLAKGVESGWIDVYENEGKTSGAYSFGSYDSDPYILCNYDNKLGDVFTIIHELGHSMHSSYTRENQPFCYGDHSIFTAEVASTVNESLLIKHLLKDEQDVEKRKYLINYYLEEFRTTLFRQTMFAEFEHICHKEIESGGALTTKWMNEKYEELNNKYFAGAVAKDDFIQYEWMRIPHFYRSFYVYQYATGYSAATAISEKILAEGPEKYIEFLKTGSSDYPVELLKIAGLDMSSPEPIVMAMETFQNLVEELEKLL
ncbi:MAG: oligoendopeptidase F [Clostridia bacterium]|nr:oligoendopeptidase F [Clostridia bacterium]